MTDQIHHHIPGSLAYETLELGQSAQMTRTVSDADVLAFADISGDRNPVHLDDAFANASMFKGRIAHGMLTAGYVSAVFAMQLPGPGAIYISQTLNFRAPVRIGDTVVTEVTIKELFPAKRRVLFGCVCRVGATVVLEGDAILMLPRAA
jgi:3-hydroxybutyryl-CoA dehydratase